MENSHDGAPRPRRPGAGEPGARSVRSSRSRGERNPRQTVPVAAGERSVERGRGNDSGRVYLVGAGPGDPELLTRRAWDVLRSADAVLHDSLTADELLEELPPDVTAVDVGKRPPDPVPQDEIHDRLASRARAGETVARLKGGDPNLYGRGGEEAEHLAREGIDFEVVPGVSSLLAAPSVAGIPLTHREHASTLTVVPGHETPEKEGSALDWGAIADSLCVGGTLVVLMGVSSLPAYTECLREEGVPGGTPVALVQKATWDDEQTVTTTLANAPGDARAADVQPPAVTIVGDVVAVRERVADSLRPE